MLPKKDPRYATTRRYGNTRRLTLTTPRFAEGKGSPADYPPDAVRSLNPTGVNETRHPGGKGVNTAPEDSMPQFSMLDAVHERPWEMIGSVKLEGIGEIVVSRTTQSHFIVKLRFENSSLRQFWPCQTTHEVMKVLYKRFDAGRFATVCWAFLGKVW